MDSARQVIRWSMPGWIFLFGLTIFQSLQNIYVFGSVGAAMEHSALSQLTTGAAAIVIGSGVPLGFLIYQLYYHTYDKWMPFSLAPQDRGADILRNLPDHVRTKLKVYEPNLDIDEMCEPSKIPLLRLIFGPDLLRLKPQFRDRTGKDRYRKNRQVNFEVIRFYLTVISTEVKSDNFRSEYTNLSDIYNAIGASRMALILSFVLYIFYNALSPAHRHGVITSYMVPLLMNVVVFGWIIAVIQSRRTRTGIACQEILSNTANWYSAQKEGPAGTNDLTTL